MTKRGPLIEPTDVSLESLRYLAYSDPRSFPMLLDSSATGPLGRYSILGAFPQARLWLDEGGHVHAEGEFVGIAPEGAGFLNYLQSAWRCDAESRRGPAAGSAGPANVTLPFRGGWMVFLSYEMAIEVEPQLQLPLRAPECAGPRALAVQIPVAVVFDQLTQRAWCVAERGHEPLLGTLKAALTALPSDGPLAPQRLRTAALPPLQLTEEAPEHFQARVLAALDYIRAGDIYQANLSRPWRGQFNADEAGQPAYPASSITAMPHKASWAQWLTAALYERLRLANPAPFAALVQHEHWRLLCSSPERLVSVSKGLVQTRPIAGTRPRSRQSGQDAREIAALIAHPKERAEHVMLVDLERNDLGRICQAGSVVADEMMFIESYAHVHHIVSNVTGRLRPGLTPVDVLRAVFPGGTITGCPKFRCMQIIAELEGEARGAYTGAVGYLNHDGSMDFNILIRTLTLCGSRVAFRAGGGIVADSNWQRELQETRAKARGLLAALQQPPAVP